MTKPSKQRKSTKAREADRTLLRDLPVEDGHVGEFAILDTYNSGNLIKIVMKGGGQYSIAAPKSEIDFWKNAEMGIVYVFLMHKYLAADNITYGKMLHIKTASKETQDAFHKNNKTLIDNLPNFKQIPTPSISEQIPSHTIKIKRKVIKMVEQTVEEEVEVTPENITNAELIPLDKEELVQIVMALQEILKQQRN